DEETEDTRLRGDIQKLRHNGKRKVWMLPHRVVLLFRVLDGRIVLLGLEVRNIGKVKDTGQNSHDDGNAYVGNVEGFRSGAVARGVSGIEEHAADDGSEDPPDAIAGLCEVDACCGVFP